MDIDLPPEFTLLLEELALQPEAVRQIWSYALTLMMVDDEKARVIGTQEQDGETFLHIRTITGDEFRIVQPKISFELEQELLRRTRLIQDRDAHE